jgi:hypothetical protein
MNDQDLQSRFIGITIEGVLRPCEIYPLQVAFGHGYVWEWAAADRSTRSQQTFDLFFDCLEDARKHGYEPHFLGGDMSADLSVVPVSAPA